MTALDLVTTDRLWTMVIGDDNGDPDRREQNDEILDDGNMIPLQLTTAITLTMTVFLTI